MPGLVQSYDVLLDFTNDTHDFTSLQLLRDFNNRNGSTAGAVLIPPGETVTLVLDAGSVYKYVLKTCTKVASVTARTWRDVDCPVSSLFIPSGSTSAGSTGSQSRPSGGGVSVDKVWKDMRVAIWDWEDRL
ncbi:hypothetical protein BJ322DRAFT_1006454 [Thelephora terrestris]|uniref:Uncharacterized protein n=1 Tax=Thelephora terrestris TaxID=56493 RepID=A0A9P6HHP5_9AGAM|nr:hypothetical protein BJ322DRAFT_1006454 [Thelephora terrestris]